MGNLLDLDGFVYMDSRAVRDELKELVGDSRPGSSGAPHEPSQPNGPTRGLIRIGDVPIYAVDAVVRRGKALQHTRDAQGASLGLNEQVALKLGLQAGDKARVTQDNGEVVLEVEVDAAVPDGCARVRAGVPETAGLGPCIGDVSISKI